MKRAISSRSKTEFEIEKTPTKLTAATTGISAHVGTIISRLNSPIIGRFRISSATFPR